MSRLLPLIIAVFLVVACASSEPAEDDDPPSSSPTEVNHSDHDGINDEESPEEIDPNACESDVDCVAQGCNGEVCAARDAGIMTTCEWRDEYACYRTPITTCGCQEGTCEWDQTEALSECLDDPPPLN